MAPYGQLTLEPLNRVRARGTCSAPSYLETVLRSLWSVPPGLPVGLTAGSEESGWPLCSPDSITYSELVYELAHTDVLLITYGPASANQRRIWRGYPDFLEKIDF